MALYREVTSQAARVKWAWFRLGIHEKRRGEFGPAVVALQNALRSDVSDHILWEALGDAYVRQVGWLVGWLWLVGCGWLVVIG